MQNIIYPVRKYLDSGLVRNQLGSEVVPADTQVMPYRGADEKRNIEIEFLNQPGPDWGQPNYQAAQVLMPDQLSLASVAKACLK